MAIGQQEIGRRIAHAREEANLTQQDLADRIGIKTAQSISRYERGLTEVSGKRLRRIAEATGHDLGYFVREIDEAPPENISELRAELASLRELVEEQLALLRRAPARESRPSVSLSASLSVTSSPNKASSSSVPIRLTPF